MLPCYSSLLPTMKKASTTARSAKIALAHFKKATKEPVEQLKFYIDPDDVKKFYVMIHHAGGNDDEYQDGEYIARIELPEDFPFSPPSFYFMTPTGLYAVEKKVCISIGEYHKDEYRAALGLLGFTKELLNGLIGWKEMGGGINLAKPKIADLRSCAESSVEYNTKHNAALRTSINECFELYSAKWKLDVEAIDQGYRARLGL